MKPEEILESYPELEWDQVLKAMEEYGKIMYNQAIADSLGVSVQQSGLITDEIVECILKLKKK